MSLLPVDERGAGDVPQLVRRGRVVVDFEDSHLRVGEVSGQPVRGDQDFWMGVFGHEEKLLWLSSSRTRSNTARHGMSDAATQCRALGVSVPRLDSSPCQTGSVPSRASDGG